MREGSQQPRRAMQWRNRQNQWWKCDVVVLHTMALGVKINWWISKEFKQRCLRIVGHYALYVEYKIESQLK